MQRTCSTEPLERVAYFAHGPNRPAEVYLRENIEQIETALPNSKETQKQYVADEVSFTTTLTREEVEENFDALWVKAETSAKSQSERMDELEELVGAVIDEVLGVA